MSSPIYVEIEMAVPFERLWAHTQDPALHERWDLRFTRIKYLPRTDDAIPQRFLYETRIGFGLRISGTGETVGTHESDRQSTSALRFASDDPKSLIREGSGYWKYIREDSSMRFLTRYDYRVRFGWIGRALDAAVFRPLLGWATAWSFDRLRLWLEAEIDPSVSAIRVLVNTLTRFVLASIWIYQGLVPKLILQHPRELELVTAAGFDVASSEWIVLTVGSFEIVVGLLTFLARGRWMFALTILILSVLLTTAFVAMPSILVEPFNPVALTTAMIGLALIGWIATHELPSARRCRRKPGREANE